MIQTGLIDNAHADLVTDASYDFYGTRLATCSVDQRIKIWQLNESEWTVQDDWRAHDATISKLSWAHPQFGTILASASFDRTVKIWEQTAGRWHERAALHDARGTIRSVEFAPSHFGLKLATISSDNYVRVYECLEQPSLVTWQLCEEIDILTLSPRLPSRLLNTQAIATPTLTHSDSAAPTASLVAQALQNQGLTQLPKTNGITGGGNREADGGWSISWCKDQYWGQVLAASASTTGVVKVIQISPSKRPQPVLTLDPYPQARSEDSGEQSHPGHNAPPTSNAYAVTSVAWAPSCGRSYHLIATASRDGHVRIWKIHPPDIDGDDGDEDGDEGEDRWTANMVADFDSHKSSVGRVEWNITGTTLSSAGNDGSIRLWKATTGNVWRPAGSIGVEQVEEKDEDGDKDKEADKDVDMAS